VPPPGSPDPAGVTAARPRSCAGALASVTYPPPAAVTYPPPAAVTYPRAPLWQTRGKGPLQ